MFYIYGIYQDVFRALNYCTCGLAYTTLRFLITSCIVTIARYVDITTMQGTKNIVRNNIILFNIKWSVTNVSEKSIVETYKRVLVFGKDFLMLHWKMTVIFLCN